MNRALALPLLTCVAVYALVGPSPAVAGGLGLLVLAPQLFKARVEVSGPAQLVLGIVLVPLSALVLGIALPQPSGAVDQLRTSWAAFCGGTLFVAALRLYVQKPWGGDASTLALALAALVASGGTQTGIVYPSAVALFLGGAALARRSGDVTRAPLGRLGGRFLAPLALLCLVATTVTVSSSLALPRLQQWFVSRVMMRGPSAMGFSDRLWLGSMRGMLRSDRTVLRVRGPDTDHLRGIVYTNYQTGRWAHNDRDVMGPAEPPKALPPGADLNEIEIVERDPRRYFLPLGATDMAVPTGVARVDRLGILAPIAANPASRIFFRTKGWRTYRVARPDPGDVELPRKLRRVLRPLALDWTRGQSTTPARLAALERHLQKHYRYSLDFDRSRYRDPVLEFLLDSKQGHCEYFASSMALLARALDIPARVVAGYRVSEKNPLGGYYIVREKNAHAWVEAWVPGRGWRTFDPTPPGELGRLMATTMPWGEALVDVLGTAWAAFLSWLDRRTWAEVATPLFALMLLGALVRWWRTRRARDGERRATGSGPLPCFELLSQALGERGISRRPSEPVEVLGERVAALDGDIATEGAELVQRYSALRYGDVGDELQLDQDVAAFVARLRQAAPGVAE